MKKLNNEAQFLITLGVNEGRRCDKHLNPVSAAPFWGKQRALIVFITCCLLLVCPFHFPPQGCERGTKTRRRRRSTSKSIPVYCPLSAATDVDPLSCSPETHLCPVGGGGGVSAERQPEKSTAS